MGNRLDKYFDWMAVLIRKVLDAEQFSDKDFQSILCDKENKKYLNLRCKFPELICESGTFKSIRRMDLKASFYERIKCTVMEEDVYSMQLLLYYMDRAIEDCFQTWIGFEDDVDSYNSLNQNLKETHIGIIKKVKCKWEHTTVNNNLRGILSKFYFIDYKKCQDFVVKNIVLDPQMIFRGEKKLFRIAISPVTREKAVIFSDPYERKNERTGARQYLFRVEGIANEDEITKKVITNIHKAGKSGADILVFPEMLGTQKMLERTIALLQKEKKKCPCLIVFPSIWKKTEADLENENKSAVVLNGERVLFEQKKYGDFWYSKDGIPIYEDINREKQDQILYVIHIEGLGRICILICYDYLEEENREKIIKNVCPTLVCSPSFSTGSFHFKILSGKYFDQNCNWVWCNTCAAEHEVKGQKEGNFKIVGAITTLSKVCDLTEPGTFENVYKGRYACEKEECEQCIYYGEISLEARN